MMSSGKTEFSFFVARKNAEIWNKVLFINLELPEYDMKLRIARKKWWVSKYDFQTRNYTAEQKEIMSTEFKKLERMENLYLESPQEKTLWALETLIRRWQDNWCTMFIIDNLDKIVSNDKESENDRYQRITSFLQDMKNENNICLVVIHHAKKPDNKWLVYKKSWLGGMRWSQKIMDNATQVFEIFRDLDPEIDDSERNKVEIIQMKDTFEWANWYKEIYFWKGDYYDAPQQETFKF